MRKIAFAVALTTFIYLASQPALAAGAILSVDPLQQTLLPGQSFPIAIKLNTNQESANTAVIDLTFPPKLLQLEKIEKNLALTSLWFDNAESSSILAEANQTGEITLIPGSTSPGFGGEDLTIAILTFTFVGNETADIAFKESSAVYRQLDNSNFLAQTENGTYSPAASGGDRPAATPSPASPNQSTTTPLPTQILEQVDKLPQGGITAHWLILLGLGVSLILGGSRLLPKTSQP